jgi:hypothetical protein
MKYLVLVPKATIGDKQYSEGDIIDTKLKLSRAWPTRFKEVKGAAAKKAKPAPKKETPEITKPLPIGQDVTSEFEYALEAGVKVFKKGENYIVTKNDTPDVAVNEDPMSKSETLIFIEGL